MTRVWVYQRMAVNPTLASLVGTRIFPSTSLNAAPQDKPFIMYRQTSDVADFRGDGVDQTRQVGFMIFAHDMPGDYRKIDTMVTALKSLFSDVSDSANNIITSTWLETSEDVRDEDMGTILKYGRILVKHKV